MMFKTLKRIAIVLFIGLFISGFFFLDEGKKKPASGEEESVVMDNEGVMAVRLAHNAAAFKLEHLHESNQAATSTADELNPYVADALLKDSIAWLEGEDEEAIEAFIDVDTSAQPVVVDELGEELVLTWRSSSRQRTEVTYKKPNDIWLATDIKTTGSEFR